MRGVMMPGNPQVADYDDPMLRPVLGGGDRHGDAAELPYPDQPRRAIGGGRGPKINGFLSIIRGNQDMIGTFIFGGVFDRHPKLKMVCVEADAGWVPHFMYRMDHAYNRHRAWMLKCRELQKMPSDYFRDHVYLTFQDDWVAFKMKDLCNYRRLMWANDFPHSDSTWPWSQEILAEHTKDCRSRRRTAILHDNVADLYSLSI